MVEWCDYSKQRGKEAVSLKKVHDFSSTAGWKTHFLATLALHSHHFPTVVSSTLSRLRWPSDRSVLRMVRMGSWVRKADWNQHCPGQGSNWQNLNNRLLSEILQKNMSYRLLSMIYWGFLIRMVYLYYISCLRYTILVGNPQYVMHKSWICDCCQGNIWW